MNYLKSFSVGDVWVAVGWSSDVIPAAKRMSNVAVLFPSQAAAYGLIYGYDMVAS